MLKIARQTLSIILLCCLIGSCQTYDHKTDFKTTKFVDIKQNFKPEATCDRDNVFSIAMPLNHLGSGSDTFQYRYQHIIRNDDGPTIIYLTGGPGTGGIGGRKFPGTMNYIHIDPRGLGCNFQPVLHRSPDLITTTQTALDIVKIIEHLGLRNYIIYGHSYGTVVATQLVQHIEKIGILAPRGVLLEAALGKSLRYGKDDYLQNYQDFWDIILKNHPLIASFLDNDMPLGISKTNWGEYIADKLGVDINLVVRKINRTINIEALAETDRTDDQLLFLKNFKNNLQIYAPLPVLLMRDLPYDYDGGRPAVKKQIWCRELAGDPFYAYVSFSIGEKGRLFVQHKAKPKLCDSTPTLDRPYDSKAFQMGTPIYYLQGEYDIQTPKASAHYHFEHQQSAVKKEYILVKGGGHLLTFQETALKPCFNDILEQVIKSKPLGELLGEDGKCPQKYYHQ